MRDTLVYGLHAAEAALANPRRVVRAARLTKNAADRLEPALKARGLVAEIVAPGVLDARLGDAVHQGALLEVEALETLGLADITSARLLIILDQITDPHNVGAIWRSAAVFGADAVVLTARHSPPFSGALAKAASGAVDLVPAALVPNLAQALAVLGDAGMTRIGLDSEAPQLLAAGLFGTHTALVLGAEDKGLRRLTREHCDVLARIATAGGPLASLNVSNAAAVALSLAPLPA